MMAENLKFSISLPVLNAEKYLSRCLDTICGQDYPRELIEVLLVDAGSSDKTLEIAGKYGVKIYHNEKKLGEYGMQIAVRNASGDLLILFAADNGLVDKQWLREVSAIFQKEPQLSCLWGKMIASADDPAIMKYYELIQSEPLAYFLNRNVQFYMRKAVRQKSNAIGYQVFQADSARPLCWGANGIVYRLDQVKHLFLGEKYIGDNEVFQYMVEEGHSNVAYSEDLNIYHHTVSSFRHWCRKWKRNYTEIFLKTRHERRIDWFYYGHFKLKMALWLIYALIPVFSLVHSLWLMIRDRNYYWLYHPLACFAQTVIYIYWTLALPEGRKNLAEHIFEKKP